jgi:tetratricopeptide (TPR) repeat protein
MLGAAPNCSQVFLNIHKHADSRAKHVFRVRRTGCRYRLDGVRAVRGRKVVDERALAESIGARIRSARLGAGLTQEKLAAGRYTKAYISALEKGHAKPSMAALSFIAERLGIPAAHFLANDDRRWSRLEADVQLAAGNWDEAVTAYESLAAVAGDRVLRAESLRGLAEALCRQGRGLDAIRPAAEAFELFDAAHSERDAALAGYWLAYGHYLAENPAEARSVLRALLDRVRAGLQVEPDLQMRLLTAAAYVETWDGNHHAAVAYLEEARGLSSDLDDRRRAALLSAMASAYYDSGDIEGAVRAGTQSLALFRTAEARHEMALVANNLANAYLAIGNLTRASGLAEEARREHESLHDEREMATVLDTEARIMLASGDAEGALVLAARAVEAAQAVDNRKAATDALVTMARACVQAGRSTDAVKHYEAAAVALREQGPHARLAEVLTEWADMLASAGDHQTAYRLTREALAGGG